MSGHVFVVQADVTRLACDAWLVPTDRAFRVEALWKASPERPTGLDQEVSARQSEHPWQPDEGRVRAVPASEAPRPWLVNVGSLPGERADWFAAGAREYIERASAQAWTGFSSDRRPRPLIALHPVGIGKGGASEDKGKLVPPLLDVLYRCAEKHDIDIALVARDPAVYAACQDARFKRSDDPWPELGPELEGHARELGVAARDGHLVLFAGAGIGQGAGLPLWGELLTWLAGEVGLAHLTKDLESLDALDQARLLANHLKDAAQPGENPDTLGALISRKFDLKRHALSHALLATLPVTEAVTTNYDELLELAAISVGKPFTQIPYERAVPGRRWLLKMHGSICAPNDIVLTRDDYLSYGRQRGALAGLVQALLITRRMLFVGFSLRDDNFHRIAYDVRSAVRMPHDTAGDPFGTVLLMRPDPLFHTLWENDLQPLPVTDAESSDDQLDQARHIEIFLDCLGAHAASRTTHLLDETFADLLDDDERDAAASLRRLRQKAETNPDSATWRAVLRALEEFSGGPAA